MGRDWIGSAYYQKVHRQSGRLPGQNAFACACWTKDRGQDCAIDPETAVVVGCTPSYEGMGRAHSFDMGQLDMDNELVVVAGAVEAAGNGDQVGEEGTVSHSVGSPSS